MIDSGLNMSGVDGIFIGFHGKNKKYPSWRYHKVLDPIIVKNTDEDRDARSKGFDEASPPMTANTQLHNWYWDLEDMSVKQLCAWAQDEYGVELPVEAGQEKLHKVIIELARFAPQNRGRLVYMAHTIRMNYEETLETIRKMVDKATDVTTMEFVA